MPGHQYRPADPYFSSKNSSTRMLSFISQMDLRDAALPIRRLAGRAGLAGTGLGSGDMPVVAGDPQLHARPPGELTVSMSPHSSRRGLSRPAGDGIDRGDGRGRTVGTIARLEYWQSRSG